MNKNKIFRSTAAALAVGALLAVLPASGALAYTDRGTPPADGNTYRYGMPLADFKSYAANTPPPNWSNPKSGGWIQGIPNNLTEGPNASGKTANPGAIYLGEPAIVLAGGFDVGLQVPIYATAFKSNTNTIGASYVVGSCKEIPNAANDNVVCASQKAQVTCGSALWTQSIPVDNRSFQPEAGSLSSSMTWNSSGTYKSWIQVLDPNKFASCPYVISIEFYVNWYPLGAGVAGVRSSQYLWLAENAYTGVKYANGATFSPGQLACSSNLKNIIGAAYAQDCLYESPGGVDPTDFNTVCANPPAMVWLDFSWLPNTIGFYARCLFQPVGTFDRSQLLSQAWNASPAGSIVGAVTSAVSSLDVGESCGPITGSGPSWFPIVINSCSWTYASTIKIALTIAITLGGAFYIISFVVACIQGVLNRKTPNPVGDGDSR